LCATVVFAARRKQLRPAPRRRTGLSRADVTRGRMASAQAPPSDGADQRATVAVERTAFGRASQSNP
jgi:hypothetical protein